MRTTGYIAAMLIMLPIGAGLEWWRASEVLDSITDLITCTFLGKPKGDLALSLRPELSAEMFCQPLTAEELDKVHRCTAISRKNVGVELFHWWKMLVGVADLAVTYDFEGTTPDGETITVQDRACLRVHFDDMRSRLGTRSLTLTKVERWQPKTK